jgi:hypothetical protein
MLFYSLRRLHDGFTIPEKWFRDCVGMVSSGRPSGWRYGWKARPSRLNQRAAHPGDARRSRGSADGERDKAGAKQDKAGHGHCEETVGSEFFTHGSPPVVCPWLERNDCRLAQSKGFPSGAPFGIQLMILCNTAPRGGSSSYRQNLGETCCRKSSSRRQIRFPSKFL